MPGGTLQSSGHGERVKLQVRELGPADLPLAREYARADVFSRSLLHASLEVPALLEHSRHWLVTNRDQVAGLAASIEGVFPYRSVPLAASLPGAASLLLEVAERPFSVLAPEHLWSELERAGARRTRSYLQMARLRHPALPDDEPDVESLADLDELQAYLGPGLSKLRLDLGPFYGIRDGSKLVVAGGTEFVTPRLAQLAWIQTSESQRRRGLARMVVAALLRDLETPARRVILQVHSDNAAARDLYTALSFRGTRRLAKLEVS